MATRDDNRDLGFGSVVSQESRRRLVNRDGSFNVVRDGLPRWSSLSLYHALIGLSWPRFLALAAGCYVLINGLFAGLYLACGSGSLQSMEPFPIADPFLRAFFFSVETFGTIGYGNIAPVGLGAHVVVTVESFAGLASLALATGLMFARFARPTARLLFSRSAIVAPYQSTSAFEFRVVNLRRSQLLEVECKVILSRIEPRDGKPFRNYYTLALERTKVSFFPAAWTIVHPIDGDSPLRGATRDSLLAEDAEFIVLLTGYDEAFAATVHTRTSYKPHEIVWGARFADLFNHGDPRGVLSIDVARLHQVVPAPLPEPAEAGEASR
ncbi:MAG TPA: ion channel [Gemmatimonadales bacterium]|nr:ion channel [Gemmatimonadales bacterium]